MTNGRSSGPAFVTPLCTATVCLDHRPIPEILLNNITVSVGRDGWVTRER